MVTLPGEISTADEVDPFQVDLIGGVAYTIGVQGADSGLFTLPDPAFIVFDSANTLVAAYDDTEFGRDPSGVYTPPNSGTYTIAVYDITSQTGTYQLNYDPSGSAASDFFFA